MKKLLETFVIILLLLAGRAFAYNEVKCLMT